MDYLAKITEERNKSERGYSDVDFAKAVAFEWKYQDQLKYPKTSREFATVTAAIRAKAFLFRR